MIALIKVVIMGVVQGLSEFLPISSSAHLVFTTNIFQYITQQPIPEESSYDIVLSMMLHIGTLTAVFIFFSKEVVEIWNALIKGIKTHDYTDYNCKLGIYIIVGTMITIVIGFLLNNVAEDLMTRPDVVGFLLTITGILLFLSEKYSDTVKDKEEKLSKRTAIIMSIAQGFAVLPGFSRSGWTIAGGLLSKANRTACARYSFLLSIPIILGASIVYPLKEINIHELISYNWIHIGLGTITSTIVGYICIKYFLKFLSKYSLRAFAYYCFVIGIITTIVFTLIRNGIIF